jgi:hypothetical protein
MFDESSSEDSHHLSNINLKDYRNLNFLRIKKANPQLKNSQINEIIKKEFNNRKKLI